MMISFFVCVASAFLFALGNILQKNGLNRSPHNKNLILHILQNWPWWLGLFLSALATFVYYYALTNWELSFVQSLMFLNPLLTVLMASYFFKERLGRKKKIAIVLCIPALILLTQGQNIALNQESRSIADIYYHYFLIISFVSIGFLFVFFRNNKELLFSFLSGICFAFTAIVYRHAINSGLLNFSNISFDYILYLLRFSDSWLYTFFYFAGFFTSQYALFYGRASVAIPLATALSTSLPGFVGIFIFGESLSIQKELGFILICISVFLFVPKWTTHLKN